VDGLNSLDPLYDSVNGLDGFQKIIYYSNAYTVRYLPQSS